MNTSGQTVSLPEALSGGTVWYLRVPEQDRANRTHDIAEAYAVELSAEIPGGCLIWGLYRGVWHANVSARYLVFRFLSAHTSGERLPQRFRYRKMCGDHWRYGVAVPHPTNPPTWRIECLNSCGFGGFESDPWEILGHILGDVAEFEWIDHDYAWSE